MIRIRKMIPITKGKSVFQLNSSVGEVSSEGVDVIIGSGRLLSQTCVGVDGSSSGSMGALVPIPDGITGAVGA